MVDTSHIDPRMETDTWWLLWVIFVAEKLQLINTTFMYRLKHKEKVTPPLPINTCAHIYDLTKNI